MRRLNLGCGSRILSDHVNVDIVAQPGVDVVHDLDVAPWPFEDRAFGRVEAKDIFEHVASPITFVTECHRVLKRGGVLHIRTPYWRSPDAFTDPTHRRFPTEHTFDYWIPGTELFKHHNPAYGGVSFQLLDVQLVTGSLEFELRKTDG